MMNPRDLEPLIKLLHLVLLQNIPVIVVSVRAFTNLFPHSLIECDQT